jgi:cytochrome c-type biogenesis protein CcmH
MNRRMIKPLKLVSGHLSTPVSGSLFALLLLVVFLSFLAAGPVRAQSDPAPAAPSTITADDVNDVARTLWCPLCSGVRLDSCELKACDQMKDVIAIKLGEGEDVNSIRDYFVEQYGPQVMGEPPRSGFNLLAWLLPIAVAVGGGVFLWTRARRMVQAPVQSGAGNAETGVHDEYSHKLDEELKQYD